MPFPIYISFFHPNTLKFNSSKLDINYNYIEIASIMNNSQIQELQYPRFSSSIQVFREVDDAPEELKAKQQFLRRQIFDVFQGNQQILNLFTAYFQTYLKQKKGISQIDPDPNLLTLPELQEMSNAFKQKIKQRMNDKKDQKLPSRSRLAVKSILFDQLSEQAPEKTFYGNGSWDYTMRLKNIGCKKEKYFFHNSNARMKVSINKHQVRKERVFFGIGSKETFWLELTSSFLQKKVSVNRCIDDFFFLQRILRRIFPHSFIPHLNITEHQIKIINQGQWIQRKLVNKCQLFINSIIAQEQLIENVYSFRFFVEEKESNYQQHKNNNFSNNVTNFEEFKTISGEVQIDISIQAECAKKLVDKKSAFLQQRWTKISNLTIQISQKLMSADDSLCRLFQELKLANENLAEPSNNKGQEQLNEHCQFSSLNALINAFKEIISLSSKSLLNCQKNLLDIKKQFVDEAAAKWSQFNSYKRRMLNLSEEYKQKRREFLQSEGVKLAKSGFAGKGDLKIEMMNLLKNEAQHQWISKNGIWHGHMNSKLLETFTSFVQNDQQQLKKSLKQAIDFFIQNSEKKGDIIQMYGLINR